MNELEVFDLGKKAGSFGFRADGGLVVATQTGFAFWSQASGLSEDFARIYPRDGSLMMNDGRVDSQGRFWAGSKGPAGSASLFRLNVDGTYTRILDNLSISNGLDWSADEELCYFTDSGEHSIFRFAHRNGQLRQKPVFSTLGVPSARQTAYLDSAGNIWSAIWDGCRVIQLSPQGEILQEIHLPVSRPTSLCLAADLRDLYITSASVELSPEMLADQPQAGDLFHAGWKPGLPPPSRANFS